MDSFIPAQCAARSLGPANQLISFLVQTLVSSYCTNTNPGWPANCDPVDGETFDFIVVGAGAAGCIVAGRLSENPNFRVLVLEAGGDPPIESEIPYFLSLAIQRSQFDWQYYAKSKHACLGTVNKTCLWSRGKMLGGSATMNDMLYIRGNERDYDIWESLGNPHWNYKNMLKYMKKWEGNENPCIADYDHGYYHNKTGPHKVELSLLDPNVRVFLEAAKEVGDKKIIDINANKPLGVLNIQAYLSNGVRTSTAKAYLIPAQNRPNLCIRKYSHVYKILFDENKRAIGVQYNYNGTSDLTAYARKEVVLSAGAIGSTQLLLLSGIGPKYDLNKFNIETISDLPVGKRVIDHIAVPVFFKMDRNSPPPTEALDDIYDYFIHRCGPYTSIGGLSLGGFVNTRRDSRWPDIQLAPYYFEKNSTLLPQVLEIYDYEPAIIEKLATENMQHQVLIGYAIILQPNSVGNIKLRTKSYLDHPLIWANHLGDPDDEKTVVRGVKHIVSFENTKAFKKSKAELVKLPLSDCEAFEFRSNDYWKCYNRHMSFSVQHAVATSKMGPKNDPTSVVDSRLLMRGVSGLCQVDLGVAPYIPSANTYAAAMAIGEKGADLIKKRHRN